MRLLERGNQATVTIHARRDVPALPDLVFNAAADPARLAAWLPAPYQVVGRADDVLILRQHEEPYQVSLAADYDRLLLTWKPLADHGCRGVLRVSLAGVAGSVAELQMDGCADDQLPSRLLEALANEVEQNLTAG
ncbi:hypothetical protein ALI22I_10695 [Saccharothrix sp. ALI-22-I]|nr:hypothetical protein ALI22I_10695 [Saccharothrix sp. ALI-22-I]